MSCEAPIEAFINKGRNVNVIRLHYCFLAIASAMSISGCGGGQGMLAADNQPPGQGASNSGTPAGGPPPVAGTGSLAEQIKALEESGRLPRLDRSSDVGGPDLDHNLIRDDIQSWIEAQPYTAPQKQAAFQLARAYQQTLLIDPLDARARNAARLGVTEGINCVGDRFHENYKVGERLMSKLAAMTANTRERARRYARYNGALSGSSWSFPTNDTCH